MTRVGLVGSIGPESTIDYYRFLVAAGHTSIVIDSLDVVQSRSPIPLVSIVEAFTTRTGSRP